MVEWQLSEADGGRGGQRLLAFSQVLRVVVNPALALLRPISMAG